MSRSIEKTVTIAASPEIVWRALTEAEELKRWFPVDARVKPGLGGFIWLSWGEGAEGEAPITVWEPGRRLQWTQSRGPVKIAVDFHIEATGGGTTVRLVQSGFGDGAEWDDEFHMTDGGWSYFMQHLRWYLERHAGVPRDLITCRDSVALTRADAMNRLLGRSGLSSDASFARCSAGDDYSTTTVDGTRISGTIIACKRDTGQLGFTMRELNDAIVFIEMEPHARGVRPALWLSTYGLDAERLTQARLRFEALYRGALGPSVPGG